MTPFTLWFFGDTHVGTDKRHGIDSLARVLTFTPDSDEVRIRCYMHTDEFLPKGWYDAADRVLKLPRRFEPHA